MPPVAAGFALSPQEPPEDLFPEIVVVIGRDALGTDVCRRLVDAGQRIRVLSTAEGDVRTAPVLARAGVRNAKTIVAVTEDDQANIRVALAARDLNPAVRVVIRQFNRRLGRKIALRLANSEAVSPETHSAATYAASCLNRWVYHALEFPRYSERLVAFCRGSAAELGAADATVAELRHRRGWHVLAVDGALRPDDGARIGRDAEVTLACRLQDAPAGRHARRRDDARLDVGSERFAPEPAGLVVTLRRTRIDPIFVGLAGAVLAMIGAAALYFHSTVGLPWVEALYHVANTVTTTGGDAQSAPPTDMTRIVEIALMFGSVSVVGVLLAYVTAAITRRSIELAQGRHRVAGTGHVIVCGFGNVGSSVARYLLYQGKRIAVIDRQPDATLAAEVRARGAHVMTADATHDSTLEMAGVRNAAAMLALTDSDGANIEIALTAAAFVPDIPVIMRITEPAVAGAVERHFRVHASYSAAALAAPLVAGLALESGSRGTVDVCDTTCSLVQRKGPGSLGGREIALASEGDDVLVLRLP